MAGTENGDSERRKYFRHNLIYAPRKAKLKIEDSDYEVKDISKGGLRFLSDEKLEKQIRGILTVSGNDPEAIEGIIVWRIGNEVGLKFKAISNDAFGFMDES
ncbi:MAG: PilZ domain-containing protein [Deltaproteobacteria bacterium]|nr:PilZ domain-containing protein [Deltaproteobacteria bacterium]